MNKSKQYIINGLRTLVAILFGFAFLTRCASIMTPDGGPYDTLPPVIVDMIPANYTTNFDSKKIYIEFNEFVQLKDQQKHFFASPQMKKKPTLTIRGRGVVVTLPDSLAENTTYALNFGSTIQDNNESNPLYSMRYVFSTGPVIDSLMLSGYAEDSFNADSVSNALIFLFDADSVQMNADYDSTLFNVTPSVIAKAENNGIFLAQNLKAKPYYIYAIDDTNTNFIYEPGTDKVGFVEGTYNPAEMDGFSIWFDSLRTYIVAEPQLHFRLFTDKGYRRQTLQDSKRPLQHQALLYFGAERPQIDSIRLDSLSEDQYIIEPISKDGDTVALWFNVAAELLPDTIRGKITYMKNDSLRNLVSSTEDLRLTWRKIETKAQEKEREKQERAKRKAELEGEEWVEPKVENPFKIKYPTAKELNPLQSIVFETDYPLVEVDTTAIEFTFAGADSIFYTQPFTLKRDTQSLRKMIFGADLSRGSSVTYRLKIAEGALKNTAQQSNDSIKLEFKTLKKDSYSTVIVDVKVDEGDQTEYIVDLLTGADKLIESRKGVRGGKLKFEYVPVGEIRLKITADEDGNGELSSGDLVNRKMPERTIYVEKDDATKFTTKANWDFDFEIKATELFKPETIEMLNERLERAETKRLEEERKKALEKSGKSDNTTGGSMFGGGTMPSLNQLTQ